MSERRNFSATPENWKGLEQMTTAQNTTPAKSLGTIALEAAAKAVRNDDSAAFTATVALGLVMANRQVERAETDKDITEKENKRAFRAFLKFYAAKGGVVWRDSDHLVSGFMAIKDRKERESAASEYVDGGKNCKTQFAKPEGARLVEGLAKLRTWSFRLMADVCTNHADAIRDILAKKAAGASGQALADSFTEFVKREYGASFAKLTGRLAKAKDDKEKPDVLDSLMKRIEALTDTDFVLLMSRINDMTGARAKSDDSMKDFMGEGETESEAPRLIKAA
ncbi:hypothetical protein ABIE88_003420 [Bradyrhizobium diazoefficiens]|uniref:hypothetical protein n=1 Tax=Bradyrhizobium diazoefficiens TaxID=1355477 RepID=UPI00351222E7